MNISTDEIEILLYAAAEEGTTENLVRRIRELLDAGYTTFDNQELGTAVVSYVEAVEQWWDTAEGWEYVELGMDALMERVELFDEDEQPVKLKWAPVAAGEAIAGLVPVDWQLV